MGLKSTRNSAKEGTPFIPHTSGSSGSQPVPVHFAPPQPSLASWEGALGFPKKKMMLGKCCTQYASKFGKLSSSQNEESDVTERLRTTQQKVEPTAGC